MKIKTVYLLVPLHGIMCFSFFLCPLFFTILKAAPVGYGAAGLCGSVQPKRFLIELAAKLAGSTVETLSPFPLKPLILKNENIILKKKSIQPLP